MSKDEPNNKAYDLYFPNKKTLRPLPDGFFESTYIENPKPPPAYIMIPLHIKN